MTPGPDSHLRLARPSRDFAAAERFWVDGLGLQVLWRTPPRDPEPLVMVGWNSAGWHLELVASSGVVPTPTEEDLLVLYLDGPVDSALVGRLVAAGGVVVTSRNPYWDEWGTTVQDPDGYRLVLCTRAWD
ncbi:MAG: VOC family protein [Frankiales bacterium]|nr:VOC family protein [Frankiales bacterium]